MSNGIDLVDDGQQNELHKDIVLNNVYNLTSETSHSISKRDITSHTAMAARLMQALYTRLRKSKVFKVLDAWRELFDGVLQPESFKDATKCWQVGDEINSECYKAQRY